MKKIYGIIPPVMTPFRADDSMDLELLRRETQVMLDAGVHGISFGGSTGEGAVLTADEIHAGVTAMRQICGDELPIICGIIRNSTGAAVEAALAAKDAGADAVMVTPRFYFTNDADGNYAYFKSVTERSGLPLIIYNVIGANPITAPVMKKISGIPGVIGIKQSVGGLHALGDMLLECRDRTMIFGAQDDLLYVSLVMGAVGSISAVHTVFPRESVLIWDAVQAGDIEKAREMQYRIMPTMRETLAYPFPVGIARAIRRLGRDPGRRREPLFDVD